MSWFRHVPPKHPPLPASRTPRHSSPVSDRVLEEAKKTGPPPPRTPQ